MQFLHPIEASCCGFFRDANFISNIRYLYPSTGWLFIEQGGKLINDDTGDKVGSVFTESMPIQELKNGPYEVN
jgi:hypothetical protein